MIFPRSFYLPKDKSFTKVLPKGINAEIYSYDAYNKYNAIGFAGKAQKPSFHHSFSTAEKRAKWVSEWIAAMQASAKAKTERRAQRQDAPVKLKVGSILRASWGYDQTNIDYYEVTAMIGEKMVEIREIAQEKIETNFMQGECVPVPGKYISEPMRKKILWGDMVKIDHHHASLEIPKEIAGAKFYSTSHWTAYA